MFAIFIFCSRLYGHSLYSQLLCESRVSLQPMAVVYRATNDVYENARTVDLVPYYKVITAVGEIAPSMGLHTRASLAFTLVLVLHSQ